MEVHTFIKNKQYTHSKGSAWIHPDQQKKNRLTKEKMERPKPLKVYQAWNGLYPVVFVVDDDHDYNEFPLVNSILSNLLHTLYALLTPDSS
jgi:hypothetical protein